MTNNIDSLTTNNEDVQCQKRHNLKKRIKTIIKALMNYLKLTITFCAPEKQW